MRVAGIAPVAGRGADGRNSVASVGHGRDYSARGGATANIAYNRHEIIVATDDDAIAVAEYAGPRCLECGYSLRALMTSRRCPECGRAFDPADPWTVRLPRHPNRIARWLMRPPSRAARIFPLAAVVATAWGTRVPGWSHPALHLGILLIFAAAVAMLPWRAALARVRGFGYDIAAPRAAYMRWGRRVGRAAIVMLLLIALRPTMYLCFWASRPWLQPVADGVLAQPFAKSAPFIRQPRGLYYVGHTRRCPHGVKLFVTRPRYYGDAGPGFVYLASPGACARFDFKYPLGGGWYASD